ncbi:hypothetical protein [Streptomyces sp. CC228A]|uniref:hypothetical protein n=1 Tax=Streptomyces sp. CC228A TaxID=2898186 RepID=UPI001F41934D|nr:hypothetical protein [Streptomyces sp. CC228A]
MTEEKALELRPTDPVPGETPLLPEVVRAYPFSWGDGFAWPPETEESDRSLGYARAVLEACLPQEPPAGPEPPGERGNAFEDEYGGWPEWSAVRRVLRGRISYASEVTRASMERAEAECAALGLDTTAFTERWVLRIKGWIAEETLYWCGLMVDDEQALAPWLPELAERYARRGFAAREAVVALLCTKALPESQDALLRLRDCPTLDEETRERVAYWYEKEYEGPRG